MKVLLILLFPIVSFCQGYNLNEIGDDFRFNHFSPIYTYGDSNDVIVNYENGKLGLILVYNDSSQMESMYRFYLSGQVSLIVTNLRFEIKEKGSVFAYCTSGDVISYYPNGNLRSKYSLNSDGEIIDKVQYYKMKNGKKFFTVMNEGNIYDGIWVKKINDVCYIKEYNNGNLIKELIYKNNGWFYLNEKKELIPIKNENRKLKKIRKKYYLDEGFTLIHP